MGKLKNWLIEQEELEEQNMKMILNAINKVEESFGKVDSARITNQRTNKTLYIYDSRNKKNKKV